MVTQSQKTNSQPKVFHGFKLAIVKASWHQEIIEKLVEGAMHYAHEAGIENNNIDIVEVSGTYELPQMVSFLAKAGKYDAIVPIGCVIKGQTNHYDLICQTIAQSLDRIAQQTQIPVTFGIVSADHIEHAYDRAGGSKGNKGQEATQAAIQLALTMKELS